MIGNQLKNYIIFLIKFMIHSILNVYEWVVADKHFGKQNSSTGTATEAVESMEELGIFNKTQILVW